MLKQISLAMAFSITTTYSIAQTLSIGWGPVHSHTKQTEKLVNGKDALVYSYTQKLAGFEFPYKKFIPMLSISTFKVVTYMDVGNKNYYGYAGTDITRVDFGVSYTKLN